MKHRRHVSRGTLDEAKRLPCAACKRYGSDPDHVKTRGSGGPDTANNILPLCRSCHSKRHQMGLLWMSHKYEGVRQWLDQNGWSFDPVLFRWVAPDFKEHP